MANIVDQNAISFANVQVRAIADKYMQLYWLCKQAQSDWTSKGMAALFPNDASLVVDGAATDGRTQITGADVNVLVSHVTTVITDLEAASNLKRNQVQKVAVNQH